MAQTQHTPGPWFWKDVKQEGYRYLVGQSPNGIACCDGMPGEANARLIAAAPDLYEALIGILNVHTGAKWQTVEVKRNSFVKAQEAIAKVEEFVDNT